MEPYPAFTLTRDDFSPSLARMEQLITRLCAPDLAGCTVQGVCQVNGVKALSCTYELKCYSYAADMRPSKAISRALSAGFQRLVHRVRPLPVGSRLRTVK